MDFQLIIFFVVFLVKQFPYINIYKKIKLNISTTHPTVAELQVFIKINSK